MNRTAELLRSHNAAIGELAAGLDPRDVSALRSVPAPVATEALRTWWTSETDGLPPPGGPLCSACWRSSRVRAAAAR
ncbi:MAG: hypothetical protein M5U19_01615 [Microthrixaceae bacterium]|nr:hypothetical protein [Microthrixaceae bacterium]